MSEAGLGWGLIWDSSCKALAENSSSEGGWQASMAVAYDLL
jgi:hypothetical protein